MRARPTLVGLLAHAPTDDLDQAAGHVGRELIERRRLLVGDVHQRGRERLPDERIPPRERPVEDHAHRPDVGARVDLRGTLGLLGRHVLGRAHQHAHAGLAGVLALGELRDAEVHQLDQQPPRLGLVQEDVLGLEVAVDDALLVCGGEPDQRLPNDHHDHARLDPPAALDDELGKVAAVQHLHHDVRPEWRATEIEDVADMLAADAAGGGGLVAEAGQHALVPRELHVHQLDGDGALDQRVLGLPHRAHAALAELPHEAKLVVEHAALEGNQPLGVGTQQHVVGVLLAAVRARGQVRGRHRWASYSTDGVTPG